MRIRQAFPDFVILEQLNHVLHKRSPAWGARTGLQNRRRWEGAGMELGNLFLAT